MNDAAVFTLVIMGVSLLSTLALPVILLLVFGAAIRGKGQAAKRPVSAKPAQIGCGLIGLLCVSGFAGLMVATAGGAVHPPVVTVAAPYVCDGTVETRSQNYSYRPGQSGVARTILCTRADGAAHDITLKTIGAATVYYTLIFMAVGLVLAVLARLLTPRLLTSRMGDPFRPGPKSGLDPADLEATARYLRDRLLVSADIVRRDADAPHDDDSIRRRLEQLQALRDDNLISEEEYQAKRAEVLSSL